MKKTIVFFTALVTLGLFTASGSLAQGRGHDRGHGSHHPREKRGHEQQHHDRHVYRERHDHYRPAPRYAYRHHRSGPPPWAPAHGYRARHHVYFRDYHTFYDPYRGGYVYWQDNRWIFSPRLPVFMANVDLGRARIQVMTGIPLSRHPEVYYGQYARRYPGSINIRIPAPPLP